MKANKKHLTNQVESILADGICNCEEIDITSEKLIKLIWPYFQYLDEQNKELIEELTKERKKGLKMIAEAYCAAHRNHITDEDDIMSFWESYKSCKNLT